MERNGEELVHRWDQRAAIDVVTLVIAMSRVLRTPSFEVAVGQIVELIIDTHIYRTVVVQVLDQPFVVNLERLACHLTHVPSFLAGQTCGKLSHFPKSFHSHLYDTVQLWSVEDGCQIVGKR